MRRHFLVPKPKPECESDVECPSDKASNVSSVSKFFVPFFSMSPSFPDECLSDSECPSDRACQDNKCIDLCFQRNPCGRNAECKMVDHRTTCSCLSGYQG